MYVVIVYHELLKCTSVVTDYRFLSLPNDEYALSGKLIPTNLLCPRP